MNDIDLFAPAKAKKSLGQHFLRDENAIRRIVDLLRTEEGDQLMEIGPGPGALTSLLRTLPWQKLILLEKDEHYAKEHAQRPIRGLEVVSGDALRYPWESLEGAWKIAGNLPYNVASPLMWDIVSRTPHLSRAVFMIQKEVGDRLLASPRTKNYGALSVWIQSFVTVRKGFVIGPAAFSPPPKVDSMVVVFEPLPPDMKPKDPASLSRCIKLCFQQRRKQLQGILRHALPASFSPGIFSKLGLDPTQRPETLSVMEFQRLSSLLFSEKPSPDSPAALDDK